jgi:hypothetical protein
MGKLDRPRAEFGDKSSSMLGGVFTLGFVEG